MDTTEPRPLTAVGADQLDDTIGVDASSRAAPDASSSSALLDLVVRLEQATGPRPDRREGPGRRRTVGRLTAGQGDPRRAMARPCRPPAAHRPSHRLLDQRHGARPGGRSSRCLRGTAPGRARGAERRAHRGDGMVGLVVARSVPASRRGGARRSQQRRPRSLRHVVDGTTQGPSSPRRRARPGGRHHRLGRRSPRRPHDRGPRRRGRRHARRARRHPPALSAGPVDPPSMPRTSPRGRVPEPGSRDRRSAPSPARGQRGRWDCDVVAIERSKACHRSRPT
jgi:hypothetical protein